jgi:eukaryotic-like serine/threonine-protein kinase
MTTPLSNTTPLQGLSPISGSDAVDRLRLALAGRYRIERELGAGGMATVYLAQDERHHRGVALKVLKPDLAAVIGAERFLNEIKTTANLQHPHILPLHDSGEANGTVWYVMPLVEGESLRDRLQRETQLPIDEALTITREVASALDYAHRHGVIHRDIKPENILLHDGRAVVADFGIALAMSRTEGGARLTETGMSLGTPHYMSPEQALGERSVDARTDVYALAVVLYEMLVGEPPFTGPTVQAIVAKVMSAPAAPISALRPSVPGSVDAAVMRALAKVPADRFRTAADFAAALRPVEASGHELTAPNVASVLPAVVAPARGIARFIPWVIAAGAVIVASVLAARGGPAPDARVTAAVIPLALRTPTDLPLNEVGPLIAIAPDGSYLVFVGPDPEVAGMTALWRRSLDRLDASVIPGTRGGQRPRVMPGGKTVQFFKRAATGQGNTKFEIALAGGVPTNVPFDIELARLRDGRVLMVADSAMRGFRVGKPGDGAPRVLRAGAGELLGRTLDVSRDGRWITRARRSGQTDSIILRTPEPGTMHVVAAGVSPKFLGDDLLAFRAPDGTLQVGRLKADRSGFVTPPVAIVPNVSLAGDGTAVYDVGDDGTLVYAAGGTTTQSRITWVTARGEQPIPNVDSRVFGGVTLAPDGRHAALSVGALAGGGDVWVADLEGGTFNPLTSDGVSSRPFWLRDNRTLTYLHTTVGATIQQTAGDFAIASRRAIDTSAPADSIRGPWPNGLVDELVWSPDERYLAMRTRPRGGSPNRDISVRRLDGDSLVPFAAEASVQERGPRFSPDGNWLLYVSNRSGRDEVYAESFPGGGNRVQLSLDGGREGTWSRDGSRVFYRGPDGWMMAARLTRGATVTVGARERLFDATPYLANQFLVMYDVAADDRFLMLKLDPQPARTDVIIVRNWVQQVRARLTGGS